MRSYIAFKKKMLKNPLLRKEYDDLGPEYQILQKMLDERLKNGLTQAQLARKIGTKQSAIARFESGTTNPTIQFLHKMADALDVRLKISIR